MKDIFLDANFPRTADKRVYHLGTRAGEVANRIITVGHPTRALSIAQHLDGGISNVFRLESDRGFLLLTGKSNGTPISIVSIGMGHPNMDFMVRELRESVDGEMVIVRVGSCGGLLDIPVGSLLVPRGSVAVTRNYDFDFTRDESVVSDDADTPYRVSRPAYPDEDLHKALHDALEAAKPVAYKGRIIKDTINASTDSFYSSQGRLTAFPDHNYGLVDKLVNDVEYLASFDMETFHLFHLASVWSHSAKTQASRRTSLSLQPMLAPPPADPPATAYHGEGDSRLGPTPHPTPSSSKIRAASVQMIFASRVSLEFITPDDVRELEDWSGKAVLRAVAQFRVANPHEDSGSVWESLK